MTTEPAVYTADEVAKLLQLSTDRVYAMTREGSIPHVRLGRSVRYPRRAIHAWLDGEEAGGVESPARMVH